MTDVFLTDGDDFYLIDNYDPNGPLFHVLTRSGNDIVVGSSYRDTIEGQDGDDYLAGGGAADALYGDAGNDVLDGGEAADYIQGGSGNDIIDGGIGADQMWGGIGNDVFYVDDIFDKVFEDWGQGTDTVYASVTYVLPAGVEILIATGAGRLTLVGNDLHNTIIGNDAPNVLSVRPLSC